MRLFPPVLFMTFDGGLLACAVPSTALSTLVRQYCAQEWHEDTESLPDEEHKAELQ